MQCKSLAAASIVVGSLALALPAAAAPTPTAATTISGPASLLPLGSLWGVGSGAAPACSIVATPPTAPAGTAPILSGAPGSPAQWCWSFARVTASGVLLPGGVPGAELTPDQYAIQTDSTVTVLRGQDGVVTAIYVSD